MLGADLLDVAQHRLVLAPAPHVDGHDAEDLGEGPLVARFLQGLEELRQLDDGLVVGDHRDDQPVGGAHGRQARGQRGRGIQQHVVGPKRRHCLGIDDG